MKLNSTAVPYYLFFILLFPLTRVEAQVEFGLARAIRAMDVAYDASNNYYVLTPYNVQVFNATGSFVRSFGIPQVGSNEISPRAIEIMSDGTVVILDGGNHKVLLLDNAGQMLSSFGSFGNGAGQLSQPFDIDLDATNRIVVADVGINAISVFSKAGVYAGRIGVGYFTNLRAASVAPNGDIYGADGSGRKVYVFAPGGVMKFSFGSSGSGVGQFSRDANGIEVGPDGRVYVSMPDDQKMNVYEANGDFVRSMTIRTYTFKVATSDVIAPDPFNHIVKFLNVDGTPSAKPSLGGESSAVGKLNTATGLAFDSEGYIYVADKGNNRIQVFNQQGQYVRHFGSTGAGDTQFQNLNAMALDKNDNVYVLDGPVVKVLNKNGGFIRKFGSQGSGNGQFNSPLGIAVDHNGNIYVADTFNNRFQVFTNAGVFISAIYSGSAIYNISTTPTRFYHCTGEAFAIAWSYPDVHIGALMNDGRPGLGLRYVSKVIEKDNIVFARDRNGIVTHARDTRLAVARFGSFGDTYGKFVPGNYFNEYSMAISPDQKILAVSDALRVQLFPLTNEVTFGELSARPFVANETFTLTATNSNNYPISFSSSDPLVASVSGNVVTVHKPGKVTITAMQAGTAITPAASVERELEILGAPQTITFNLREKVELSEELILLDAETSSGLLPRYSSDNPEVASLMGNSNTLQLHKPGTVRITATQDGNEIYSPATPVTVTLIVDKVDQTIAFSQPNIKRLSDAPFELNGVSSAGLIVSYSSSNPDIISIENNIATIHAKGTTTITATQSGDDYYHAASPVTLDFIVGKESQSIAFNPIETQVISKGTVTLMATASSGLPVTFESDDASIVSIDGDKAILHRPGTVWITARQSGNDDYVAAIARSIMLTIIKDSQSINFEEIPPKTFGDNSFSLSAVTTANLPVSFESSNPAVASVTGATVTIHKAGTVIMTARQAGNEFTETAPPVARTLVIRKANSSVEFASIGTRVLGELPLPLAGVSSHAGTIRFESSNPTVASIQNNILSFNAAGTTTITAIFDETENIMESRFSREVIVELVTSAEEPLNAQVKAYPNPVKKMLAFQLQEEKEIKSASIIRNTGQHQTIVPVSEGNGLYTVDLEFLPQGLHIIHVQGEQRIYVLKIVKH